MAVEWVARVLLADDQEKVRSALRLLIEQEGSFQVVGEAGSVQELMQLAPELNPQIVLLDWELPGLPETRRLQALRDRFPYAHIVVLSGQPEARQTAFAEGADEFISKADPPEKVLKTLYFVHSRV